MEVLLDGSANVLENLFTGTHIQRAAAQVKPYFGSEEWLLKPPEQVFEPDPVEEQLPPREQRRPRSLFEECHTRFVGG